MMYEDALAYVREWIAMNEPTGSPETDAVQLILDHNEGYIQHLTEGWNAAYAREKEQREFNDRLSRDLLESEAVREELASALARETERKREALKERCDWDCDWCRDDDEDEEIAIDFGPAEPIDLTAVALKMGAHFLTTFSSMEGPVCGNTGCPGNNDVRQCPAYNTDGWYR